MSIYCIGILIRLLKPWVPSPSFSYGADAEGPFVLEGILLPEKRRITNRFESLSMVDKTRTNSLGQEDRIGAKVRNAWDIAAITDDDSHGTQWDIHIQSKGADGLGSGILALFEKIIFETRTPTTYEYSQE
jgi:hypothetical protein